MASIFLAGFACLVSSIAVAERVHIVIPAAAGGGLDAGLLDRPATVVLAIACAAIWLAPAICWWRKRSSTSLPGRLR